jgi:hypothetical protein
VTQAAVKLCASRGVRIPPPPSSAMRGLRPGRGLDPCAPRHRRPRGHESRAASKASSPSALRHRSFTDSTTSPAKTLSSEPTSSSSLRASPNSRAARGDIPVISKTIPAGTYLLFATLSLINQDGDGAHDGESAAGCSIPGYTTGTHELFFEDVFSDPKDSLALSSAINHAGAPVELRCTEEEDDVDVYTATLTAIKVDSPGYERPIRQRPPARRPLLARRRAHHSEHRPARRRIGVTGVPECAECALTRHLARPGTPRRVARS